MLMVLLSVGLVPAAMGIIVTDPPPTSTEYNYSYNVVDPRTGDAKSLHEVRRGDVVTGSYSVVDPDGTHRVVQYTADSRRGFKAVVHSEPLAAPIGIHHQAARDSYRMPSGNTRYRNPYYSSDPLYRGYSLRQPLPLATRPSASYNVQRTNEVDNRQTRYFTPSDEIKDESETSFKNGEFFAPNN